MKIDSPNRASPLTGNTPPAARNTRPVPQGGSGAQESVRISSVSSQIQAIEAGIDKASGFDLAKVEAIKQAISEGRFTISSEAIADKLIASTRELLGQQQE
jgi:negative regulator of flagellin synthesis FlgM